MAKHQTYIPALDGLRAVAVLIVMASHYRFGHIIPGGLGVTLFFVISGFIITRVLMVRWGEGFTNKDIFVFYGMRLFRLAPALYLYVLVTYAYDKYSGAVMDPAEYLGTITYTINYLKHFELIGTEHRYFGHFWSLAVEEHFYLIFPWILLITGFSKNAMRTFVMLTCIMFAWLLGLSTMATDTPWYILSDTTVYQRSDTRFTAILPGVLLAFLSVNPAHKITQTITQYGLSIFTLGIAAIVASTQTSVIGYSVALETIGCALVFAPLFIGTTLSPITKLLALKPVVWIGTISYSLYIWHVAVMWRGVALLDLNNPDLEAIVATVASIGIAALSFYVLEKPVRYWGKNKLLKR